MSTQKMKIVQGDTPLVVFTLKDRNGDPFDMTNVTEARFMAKDQSSPQVSDALSIFNVTCTIDAPATLGTCRVTLTAVNTALVGIYNAELQLKSTGSLVNTATRFVLEIEQGVIDA